MPTSTCIRTGVAVMKSLSTKLCIQRAWGVLLVLLLTTSAFAEDPTPGQQLRAVQGEIRQLRSQGNYAEAIELAERALELARIVYAQRPWVVTDYEDRLASVRKLATLPESVRKELGQADEGLYKTLRLRNEGNYSAADRVLRQQLATRRRHLGDGHRLTLTSLHMLANNLQRAGQLAEAEILHRRIIELQTQHAGAEHPRTLAARSNLGDLLVGQGQLVAAKSLLIPTREACERALGATSTVTLAAGINLSEALLRLDELDSCEALIQQLLAAKTPVKFFDLAIREVQGQLLLQQGRHEPALAELQSIWTESVAEYGAKHPDTLIRKQRYAQLLARLQRWEEAQKLLLELVAEQSKVLGEDHAESVLGLCTLAELYYQQGKTLEANAILDRAAAAFEKTRRITQHDGLERAHFDAWESPFVLWAACAARQDQARKTWDRLEASFARGLLDSIAQRHARPLLEEERLRQLELAGRFHRIEEQLSGLRSRDDVDPAELEQAERERAQLLGETLALEAELASRYDVAGGEVYDLARIQAQMAPHTALVAWLEVPDTNERWAIVVRPQGLPVCMPVPPLREGLRAEIDDLLRRRPGYARGAERAPDLVKRKPQRVRAAQRELDVRAAEVHRHRIAPLAPALAARDGLPAATHLVVLPVGEMAGLPLSVVTREHTVSYAPSGTLYAWLQERQPSKATPPVVLTLGAPAFGDSDVAPIPSSGQEAQSIAKLAGTKATTPDQELLGLTLTGAAASESKLLELNRNGRLRGFTHLHFATHAVIDDLHPLRSALLLAQDAGADPLDVIAGRAYCDGRLTAEQIRRLWHIDAELVTLSACQSALGKTLGGEGFLGFSQALFVAGARSLVLTLWKVDDRATSLLMTRFYYNLLVLGQTKLAALSEAQDWLRTLPRSRVAALLAQPIEEVGRASGASDSDKPFSHPYYWAAFVLVGNPQ